MDFVIDIERGGLKLCVEGNCDCEDQLDQIHKVSVFDGERYVEVEFDEEEFVREFESELYEGIEEYKRDLEIAAAEQRMDAMREEGWN